MTSYFVKYRVLLSVLLIFSLIFTACGGGGDTSSSEENNAESTDSNSEPKDGGELRVALSAQPMTLDPIAYTGVYESNVIKSIADTLVIYSNDLSEIEPSLATDWEISDDLKTYTFELRDDVYFQPGEYQDGRQMTAEDVKYSLERSAKESAMNRLRMVEKVEVIDDFKVKVHLKEPNSTLLAVLTDAGNVIVPKEEVEGWGDKFGQHLVGTGPFTLSEWKQDDEIKLSRHEKYWGPKPHLDSLVWTAITDQSTMANALRSGDIDIATDVKGQNRAVIEQEENLTLLTVPGLSIEYIGMNMQEGPTKDIRVRKAINMATDVDALVKGVYQWGGAEASKLPLPKGSWGYDESLEVEVPEYDPEKAKELLAEAGYPDGFDTELYVIESRVPHATIFQQQMKENLNINVEIKSVEWGTFSDIASKGDAPLYAMGWTWYPDPDFFLYQMFHSDQIGSLGNGYGYDNPEVDELLNRATQETADQDERAQLYAEALERIVKDVPRVELTNVEIAAAIQNKVKDFNVMADNSFIIVNPNNNVWIDE
ncbi:ABC transporter substrate-binding protein [Novibacillus thermophilus]|uniref:Peptide ABC transporter substrate-binding protein n=1 Tax=Novibacillus thermophilus TaxID=1471761 RepID=A0A1U9K834_9BACL|nr:ABC transporter substrate-binding protein [Novibacillus thermophilus]AQS56166.1 peptide ABC transporter substrate-binding protein [Novibacillus thermophilus]